MLERKKAGRPSGRPATEVFEELYRNHTARQIAEMYGVSIPTVKYWVKQIRREQAALVAEN